MLTEDYLLKLLKPLAYVVPRLLSLRKDAHYDDALTLIQQTGQQLTGLDPALISALSAQSLTELLAADSPVGAAQCLGLATLFYEQGKIYEAQSKWAEADTAYFNALYLFLRVLPNSDHSVIDENKPLVDDLVFKLKGSALPEAIRYNLFHFYAGIGAYAYAEDTLFDLIELVEQTGSAKAVITDGIAFYQTLKEKSDAELIAGDLPRDEVEQGLQDLLDL